MQPKAVQTDLFAGGFAYSRRPVRSNPIHRYGKNANYGKGKSFEDYLIDSFRGEIVQDGNKYSEKVTDIMRQNLKTMG